MIDTIHPTLVCLEMDQQALDQLRAVVQSRAPEADYLTRPSILLKAGPPVAYDLVLVTDEVLELEDALAGFARLAQKSPGTRWIVACEAGRMANLVKTLPFRAYDAVERPYQEEVLGHVLSQALAACRMEKQLAKVGRRLEHNHHDLERSLSAHQSIRQQLKDTGRALTVLNENLELERRHVREQINRKLTHRFMPLIKSIRRNEKLTHCALELEALVRQVITGDDQPNGLVAELVDKLTLAEFRVATLILCNLNSEAIARQLQITRHTLNTHRKNIRKKLNINSSRFNLRNYLLAQTGKAKSHGTKKHTKDP